MPEMFGGDVAYFGLAMRRFLFLKVSAYPGRSLPANYAARVLGTYANDRASPELIDRTRGPSVRWWLSFQRSRARPAARRRDGVRRNTRKSTTRRRTRRRLCENRIA